MMMTAQKRSQFYSVMVSLGVHVLALVAMFFIKMSLPDDSLQLVLDSVFSEERFQEEFEHEIEQTNEIATTMNVVESRMITSATGTGSGGDGGMVGGGGGTAEKLDQASSLKEPQVAVGAGNISIPGPQFVADDLGTGPIKGDVGRVVDGYGPALSQLTQELIRLMREQKLMVVWLFDESESMRDDQKEIRDKFHKVYEELGLAAKSDSKLRATDEILLTSIMSFGDNVTEHTKAPTSKVADVREAMDKIEIEESGKENMCKAVSSALAKYGPYAQKQQRRLAVVIVSDESGDDGELIEDSIERCKKVKAPVYILGRYSVFGYPYARMTWTDPKYKLTWWLTINRGPETPFPELLQTDGLHQRWDYDSAGFGPYEQVRLARETGGIFFILPGTEDNISGTRSIEDRRFDLLDMKEYLPDLSARLPYAKERDSSKFRKIQWDVINVLNPHKDKELEIQEIHYSADPETFDQQGARAFQQAVRSLQLFNEALRLLDTVKPLRAKEQSQRWRANYDLIHAQCKAYRVRLFQLLLALDQHKKNRPVPKITNGVQNNMWNVVRQKIMLPPDPVQVKQTKVDLDELNQQMEEATQEFQAIVENHPRTPWARRAQYEMNIGFGVMFVDGYWDFSAYANAKGIKLPTP
jgi:hypothetical protein